MKKMVPIFAAVLFASTALQATSALADGANTTFLEYINGSVDNPSKVVDVPDTNTNMGPAYNNDDEAATADYPDNPDRMVEVPDMPDVYATTSRVSAFAAPVGEGNVGSPGYDNPGKIVDAPDTNTNPGPSANNDDEGATADYPDNPDRMVESPDAPDEVEAIVTKMAIQAVEPGDLAPNSKPKEKSDGGKKRGEKAPI